VDLESYLKGVLDVIELLGNEGGQEDLITLILQEFDIDLDGNLGSKWR
jgi:hypothetical protein